MFNIISITVSDVTPAGARWEKFCGSAIAERGTYFKRGGYFLRRLEAHRHAASMIDAAHCHVIFSRRAGLAVTAERSPHAAFTIYAARRAEAGAV